MGKRLEKLLQRRKRVEDMAREGIAFCQYHDRYISIFEIDYKHCYQSRKYVHGYCPYLRFSIPVEPKNELQM